MATMTDPLDTPVEIPRLVLTPSTPTDDPPPISNRGRRPTLFRAQSLLDQMDNTLPLNPGISTTTTLRRSSPDKKQGWHQLHPLDPHTHSGHGAGIGIGTRQARPGKGTAASLVLVALAFVLLLSSALLRPETITSLLHSQTEWMASDPVEWIGVGPETTSSEPADVQASDHDGEEVGGTDFTMMNMNDGPSRDSRPEDPTQNVNTDTHTEDEHHTDSGLVMTHTAWRSYLRRKEQVTGQAGPTAHLGVWDFH